MEERKLQREKDKKFLKELLKEINSDIPYSEKKYLQEFDNSLKKSNSKNKCGNNQCCYGNEFYTNQYGVNNVNISGIAYSNYVGYCTPSIF